MCYISCQVGYFTTEDEIKHTEELPNNWGPYTNHDKIPLENKKNFHRSDFKDLPSNTFELEAIKAGIQLKIDDANKRVLVRENIWCSGYESEFALEFLSPNKVKVFYSPLGDYDDDEGSFISMLKSFNLEIINHKGEEWKPFNRPIISTDSTGSRF